MVAVVSDSRQHGDRLVQSPFYRIEQRPALFLPHPEPFLWRLAPNRFLDRIQHADVPVAGVPAREMMPGAAGDRRSARNGNCGWKEN